MDSFDLLIEPDLRIEGGDLVIGKSDDYNVMYTMHGEKGQLYHYPLVGVGFDKYVRGKFQDGRAIAKDVRFELARDGYEVKDLSINRDITTRDVTLDIKAEKTRDVL